MKDAYYFSHDSNARHDPKIISLCSKYGLIAYAYYFQLVEILRDQDRYVLDEIMFPVIANAWQSYGNAIDMPMAHEILNSMITLKLVEKVDGKIISPSLLKRMQKMDDLRRKRSESGKIGAMAKWQTDGKPMAVKERKVKEKKEIEIPPDLQESAIEIKDWLEYKRQRGENYKPKGLEALFRKFKDIDPKARREAVDFSMSNSYSGLFAPNGSKNKEVKNDSWQH